MTIEKLQKLATSITDGKYKARWLRWWNSSVDARRAYRFLVGKHKDHVWDNWVDKATFWAEVTFFSFVLLFTFAYLLGSGFDNQTHDNEQSSY